MEGSWDLIWRALGTLDGFRWGAQSQPVSRLGADARVQFRTRACTWGCAYVWMCVLARFLLGVRIKTALYLG